MKKLILALALVTLGINYSSAQTNKEDVDMVQAVFGKEKKELITAYMSIPPADSIAFWNTYDEYEVKRKALGRERIAVLEDYAANYNNLTDEKANDLAKRTLANDKSYNKLYCSYLKKFNKLIGGKNAAKLMQVETYLQTLVRANTMTSIPFIGELDKSKMK